MKTAKQEIIDLLEHLPDDISMEAFILEMQNRMSIQQGFDELDRGEGISHEEVKENLKKWRELSGRRVPSSD